MPHLTDILRSMDVSINNILHAVSGEHQFFALSTSHKKTAPVTSCGLCLHRYSSRIYFWPPATFRRCIVLLQNNYARNMNWLLSRYCWKLISMTWASTYIR